MKKFLGLLTLVALSMGFCSCTMFGVRDRHAGTRTSTKQVKDGYDTVYQEVPSESKGGMATTVEKQVPRYKTVTTKSKAPCPDCSRYYVVKKGCCGTTSEHYRALVTAQGPTGSPNIGLTPTMKPLAP
ncbi:MAG: hypothetical protein ACSHX9_04715 [Luteolibacter sp.]